jgi:DNA polymerase-1
VSRYVFDLEADALIDDVSIIHSLVLKNVDTLEVTSCADQEGYHPISLGLKMLEDASLIIGHNILCYDIPALKKVLNFQFGGFPRDTLLMSRIKWPEIVAMDKSGRYFIPPNLVGHYSLEAFGYRLKDNKGEYKDGWEKWSPKMQKYCEQDVEVTYKLWLKLQNEPIPEKCLQIEHAFQEYINIQETTGVPFNVQKALELNDPISRRVAEITAQLKRDIPPRQIQLKTKVKSEPFNPGSRQQIIKFLCEKYNWKPTVFTDKGNPSLDGDVLASLPFPEAKLFAEYFEVGKLLSMLSTGENSWLKFVRNGRLHGRVVTVGAITRRCTHSSPNLGNIPSIRAFMGKEVRSLFYAPEGYRMVGSDAAGLELRCLSHYLARFDGGAYGVEVVEGDVHTRHQKAVELDTRDKAKTFIYAFLYGAGDETLGEIWCPTGTESQKKTAGKKARDLFGERIPAYKQLKDSLDKHLITNKTLKAIDGGELQVRNKYSALNTLLQSAGSIAVKNATVLAYKEGIRRGLDIQPVLHVHDEIQSIVKTEDAEEYGKIKVQAFRDSGEDLNFRCRLDGEYKIGLNWSMTH